MTPVPRVLPWSSLVDAIGEARLAEIRAALEQDRVDAWGRDAFLLHRAAGALYRELVPEDGPPDAVTAYGTLLHMIYLMWLAGWPTRTMGDSQPPDEPIVYLQLPERRYWAQRDDAEPHEPIDGVFVLSRGHHRSLQAVLGMHEFGDGFSTIEAEVEWPLEPPGPRDDGSAPFAPRMVGGDRAGLHSVVNAAELAWLCLSPGSTVPPSHRPVG